MIEVSGEKGRIEEKERNGVLQKILGGLKIIRFVIWGTSKAIYCNLELKPVNA